MSGESQREQLRKLLRDQAILYASPAHPILHRNGSHAPWAFYSWHVTMTSVGLHLIAANLLERLKTFRSTQLASLGYTGIPILAACVQASGGTYSSVVIRELRKAYLSGRRIEGALDRSQSVIVIDDSLSSGTSLQSAITALEEEGVEVEGAIALVNFPNRGGLEWANMAGYRTECLFDIWSDLEMERTAESLRNMNGNNYFFSDDRLPDGLHPAAVSRQAAEHYLRYGCLPQPPRFLDREYDGHGGVFVSFRERDTDFRLARDGFWHFDPQQFDAARDVVLATAETLDVAAGAVTLDRLPELKIAVTFFTALEEIRPSQLDFDRYGIVVAGCTPPYRRGGALPNTQVFISETEQYQQARFVNARLCSYEPHRLYRHQIEKCVEPGAAWLPYGCEEAQDTNWWRNCEIGERLIARARELIEAYSCKQQVPENPLPRSLVPAQISGAAIYVYHRGLAGCGIARGNDLENVLHQAAQSVAREGRFTEKIANVELKEMAVTVSLLHHPEWLGRSNLASVARKLRRGLDSLTVQDEGTTMTLPPGLVPYNNWSREQYVDALLQMSGADPATCTWETYQTATWLNQGERTFAIRFGFPERNTTAYDIQRCESDIHLLGSYIERVLQDDGLPAYYVSPVVGEFERYGTAARVIHGLMALGLAGRALRLSEWLTAAQRGLEYCLRHVDCGVLLLPHHTGGALADCILLAAVSMLRADFDHYAIHDLAVRVAGLFRADGRIGEGPKRLDLPADHDYLPGAALWALGEYARSSVSSSLPESLNEHLQWYKRRFQVVPTWGAAGWQPQGWRAVYQITHDPSHQQFACAAADWTLDQQLEKNGAFLEDLGPDEPSFNTGFIAEGIAAAWSLALESQDRARATRYQLSWQRAMQFMTKLIIYPEDLFCMRAPEIALGGVRTVLSRSDVRIDQVSHSLHALCEGLQNLKHGLVERQATVPANSSYSGSLTLVHS